LDVRFGVKTRAFNALIDFLLIKMEFAVKFKLLANNLIVNKVSAKNAMKDTQLSMENVNK
jgi:hypothetical protein